MKIAVEPVRFLSVFMLLAVLSGCVIRFAFAELDGAMPDAFGVAYLLGLLVVSYLIARTPPNVRPPRN